MVQTGIPFGEVQAARDWLCVSAPVSQPRSQHPARPIQGFDCPRSEVSGRRLWGLFAERFGNAKAFFDDHFVMNYCPLAFLEPSGKNRTPDKLPPAERKELHERCDLYLRQVAEVLSPEWVIGVGAFAAERAEECFADKPVKIGRILHPSPASPSANRDWAGEATRQLVQLGVWKP
jgi:single-strand selective monofunctional uracil DNA glycosylase